MRWAFNLIYFDEALSSKNKIFAHMIIKDLRAQLDPRSYRSSKGFVEALKDFSRQGGANLNGFYKFKPSKILRESGYDIRIVFRVMIKERHVYPSQIRIPHPNERYCCIEVLFVGMRDRDTYDKRKVKTLKQAQPVFASRKKNKGS